jgi:palmitoyltransferase
MRLTEPANYLMKPPAEYGIPKRTASAIAIIVIQYVLFTPVVLAFFRFVHVVITNPGYVPRGKPPSQSRSGSKSEKQSEEGPVLDRAAIRMHEIPFPPGYERFSDRQVFACSTDGVPKFCNHCWNWKPDRTHHCHEVNRCVRRFDHYCPWVGGVVSETNNKFFIQFSGYASLYSIFLIVVCAWTLVTAKKDCKRADTAGISCDFNNDLLSGHWIAGIAL